MKLTNTLGDASMISKSYHESVCTLLTLLAPMAPHITSELWLKVRKEDMTPNIHEQPWPVVDEEALKKNDVKLVCNYLLLL